MEKKYKLKKRRFLNWLTDDHEDIVYWGNRFIEDIIENGKVTETTGSLFNERDVVPGYILEGQDENYDEVSINEIELID